MIDIVIEYFCSHSLAWLKFAVVCSFLSQASFFASHACSRFGLRAASSSSLSSRECRVVSCVLLLVLLVVCCSIELHSPPPLLFSSLFRCCCCRVVVAQLSSARLSCILVAATRHSNRRKQVDSQPSRFAIVAARIRIRCSTVSTPDHSATRAHCSIQTSCFPARLRSTQQAGAVDHSDLPLAAFPLV